MGSYMGNTAFSKRCKFLGMNVVTVLEYHMRKGSCAGRRAAEQPSPLTTRERWTTGATAASSPVSLHAQRGPVLQWSNGSRHKQLTTLACELFWSSLPSGLCGLWLCVVQRFWYESQGEYGFPEPWQQEDCMHWWHKCVRKFHGLKRSSYLIRKMT